MTELLVWKGSLRPSSIMPTPPAGPPPSSRAATRMVSSGRLWWALLASVWAKVLTELHDRIRGWEAGDDPGRIADRIRTVGEDFASERLLLAPLPVEPFDPGLMLTPRMDRSSLITVRMVKYSVPVRFIGRKVRVSLRAIEVVVFDGRSPIASHSRIAARTGTSVQLDHYLEVLKVKPGALPGSTALAAARAAGTFTSAHKAFWVAARRVNGDAAGTRELIDVLLLHRSMTAADVTVGIAAALKVGAVSADVVALEARRHASTGGASSSRHLAAHNAAPKYRIVSLTQRRLADPAEVIAGLPADSQPVPNVGAYDELLARRRIASEPTSSATDPTTSEVSHVS